LKTKRLTALLLVGILVFSLTACGGVEETAAPAPEATPAPTTQPTPEPDSDSDSGSDSETRKVSIDFEDGRMGFAVVYTMPPNADPSELDIVEWNGSKALRITNVAGQLPYIAFDINRLLGSRIEEVTSIEMTVGVEHQGGFSAVSGKLISWVGEDLEEISDTWSIFLQRVNPNKAVSTSVDGRFVAGADNILIFQMTTDNGPSEGRGHATLYIDDISFLDSDGNALIAATIFDFIGPYGFGGADYSNLIGVTDEVDLGFSGKSGGGWGQAVAVEAIQNEGTFDPAILTPDCVITVFFTSRTVPEMILQSWTSGAPMSAGWAKIDPTYVNDSASIAQFTYEAMVDAFGTADFTSFVDKFYVGDTGTELEVIAVKIGTGLPDQSYGDSN